MKTLLLFLPTLLLGQALSIDCGSPSDQFFSPAPGLTYTIQTPGATGDLTLRYGAFSYSIPAPAGNYTVSLFMRETGTGGIRRFSVAINGVPALENFDLSSTAGLNELQRDFPVTSTGTINLAFSYTLKSAVVSRIVVTPKPVVPAPTSGVRFTGVVPVRQDDGTYVLTPPSPTSISNLAVYRNGLRQKLGLDYRIGEATITATPVYVAIVPLTQWDADDVMLCDFEQSVAVAVAQTPFPIPANVERRWFARVR